MDRMIEGLTDEEDIINQSLQNRSAFAPLYDFYAPRVYTYMRYRVGNAQIADDLTAQTFEKAIAGLENFRKDRATFGAWLFGIAHHMVTRHYRTQKRQQWFSFERVIGWKSATPSPEDTTLNNELHSQMMQAVSELSERERHLIALKFAAGFTNRQIASITGLSESNVGVILYRALQKLRVKLSSEGLVNDGP